MTAETRLIDLTLGELIAAIGAMAAAPAAHEQHFVDGLSGLAAGLGVSRDTAQRIKNSGVIDDAIYYRSAKRYVTDIDRARDLINKHH